MDSSLILADKYGLSKALKESDQHFKVFWNKGNIPIFLLIDGFKIKIPSQNILCCTNIQKVQIINEPDNIFVLFFNREFYCIHTIENEVSCNGLLFFGSDFPPILQLSSEEIISFENLIADFKKEILFDDVNKDEMLRILLKRFIFRCTRIARKQLIGKKIQNTEIDIVHKFNTLVEEYYRKYKTVSKYADILNKSPKTISNIFQIAGGKGPLQTIHERVCLEAKRLLLYTDKSIKEISFELGYEDPGQFSKLFKKQTGFTIMEFREEYGKNNSPKSIHSNNIYLNDPETV